VGRVRVLVNNTVDALLTSITIDIVALR
jgi:hypothetical protein